jgi:hypothetical protein
MPTGGDRQQFVSTEDVAGTDIAGDGIQRPSWSQAHARIQSCRQQSRSQYAVADSSPSESFLIRTDG